MQITEGFHIRSNKKMPVFKVTQTYLHLLVKPRIFPGFLKKKMHLKRFLPFCLSKCLKFYIIFRKKNVYLPYLKFSDPLPETQFFYLAFGGFKLNFQINPLSMSLLIESAIFLDSLPCPCGSWRKHYPGIPF